MVLCGSAPVMQCRIGSQAVDALGFRSWLSCHVHTALQYNFVFNITSTCQALAHRLKIRRVPSA
ncbi:hypothetical protein PGTUg99_032359 [Puccinia graminis f. sp. tritici]|uniref:Uncharacterized protein n=1 Tax=Puccinia graminis f. sp. tritici TaxID=56615 RepID=A0A5B0Q926_PUCGR|nr:hypothetical protein PGTUg99_032359 [Puccinia graminis f. sp. tritici]